MSFLIIYILSYINPGGGWQFDGPDTVNMIHRLITPAFDFRSHLRSVADEYGELTPSEPVIDAFLTDALLLDRFDAIYGLSHTKRVQTARMIRRTAQRESGFGNTSLARDYNNHVGTKLARKRHTWASGKERLNYAKFVEWTYSYLDCLEYILKYGKSWIK